MQTENRTAHYLATFLAPILVFVFCTAAVADKVKISGKPIIKAGPIKGTTGDEPGTLKEVIHMRILPPSGGSPLPPITMHFDLKLGRAEVQAEVPGKGATVVTAASAQAAPNGKWKTFRLSGKGTNWQVRRIQDGFGLWIDGRRVDAVHSSYFRQEKTVEILATTEALDSKLAAAGAIRIEAKDGNGKVIPTFPDVCPPVGTPPVPVPYPIIKN